MSKTTIYVFMSKNNMSLCQKNMSLCQKKYVSMSKTKTCLYVKKALIPRFYKVF